MHVGAGRVKKEGERRTAPFPLQHTADASSVFDGDLISIDLIDHQQQTNPKYQKHNLFITDFENKITDFSLLEPQQTLHATDGLAFKRYSVIECRQEAEAVKPCA